jgi:hypothetical protein
MKLVLASPTAKLMFVTLIGIEVLAARTGLGCPVGIDVVDGESARSSLVFQHLPELSKCPSVEICTMFRGASLPLRPNSLQVLSSDALRAAILGFLHNRICKQMVLLALPSTLFPAEPMLPASCSSGALAV